MKSMSRSEYAMPVGCTSVGNLIHAFWATFSLFTVPMGLIHRKSVFLSYGMLIAHYFLALITSNPIETMYDE
jgi:hypothetical protein